MKARLAALALLAVLTSCASIMTGSDDSVTVNSMPSGAYFTTNIGVSGYTPKVVSVPASQDLIVEYRKKGYEPQSVVLESRMSAWVAGNLILGGLIGIAVDVVNPDSRTHDGTVTAQLIEVDPATLEEVPEAPAKTLTTSIREVQEEIYIRN